MVEGRIEVVGPLLPALLQSPIKLALRTCEKFVRLVFPQKLVKQFKLLLKQAVLFD